MASPRGLGLADEASIGGAAMSRLSDADREMLKALGALQQAALDLLEAISGVLGCKVAAQQGGQDMYSSFEFL